jgi:hypothetical protein
MGGKGLWNLWTTWFCFLHFWVCWCCCAFCNVIGNNNTSHEMYLSTKFSISSFV